MSKNRKGHKPLKTDIRVKFLLSTTPCSPQDIWDSTTQQYLPDETPTETTLPRRVMRDLRVEK